MSQFHTPIEFIRTNWQEAHFARSLDYHTRKPQVGIATRAILRVIRMIKANNSPLPQVVQHMSHII
jgi:hypothetical protein